MHLLVIGTLLALVLALVLVLALILVLALAVFHVLHGTARVFHGIARAVVHVAVVHRTTHGGRRHHHHVDVHFGTAFERQGQRERRAFLQRRYQAHEHDVIAARFEKLRANGGDFNAAFDLAHLHHAINHGVGVQLDPLGYRARGPNQRVGLVRRVVDDHKGRARFGHAGTGACPRLGHGDVGGECLGGHDDGGHGGGGNQGLEVHGCVPCDVALGAVPLRIGGWPYHRCRVREKSAHTRPHC